MSITVSMLRSLLGCANDAILVTFRVAVGKEREDPVLIIRSVQNFGANQKLTISFEPQRAVMLTTNEEIPESEEIGPQDDQLLDDSEDVQMTVRYLKLVSGQFDLEAIRQLNFSNFGTISRIQCLEKCRYLEYLDISRNKLKKIEGLDALTHLKRLNLSYNFIQRLEGVEKLKRLEQLNLMNNSISNLQDLMCLSNCTTLSDVNLKNNPISSISQYTQSLHGIVKKLVIVDGEHILLRVS